MEKYSPSGKTPGKRPDGRRGAGSNKSRRKKREYKSHVSSMVRQGMENDPSTGAWKPGK